MIFFFFFNEFHFYPPLVPSQASKADVQRAEGTGVTLILSPVSLPFFGFYPHAALRGMAL